MYINCLISWLHSLYSAQYFFVVIPFQMLIKNDAEAERKITQQVTWVVLNAWHSSSASSLFKFLFVFHGWLLLVGSLLFSQGLYITTLVWFYGLHYKILAVLLNKCRGLETWWIYCFWKNVSKNIMKLQKIWILKKLQQNLVFVLIYQNMRLNYIKIDLRMYLLKLKNKIWIELIKFQAHAISQVEIMSTPTKRQYTVYPNSNFMFSWYMLDF